MHSPHKSEAYLKLHIAIFLFGITAILGKIITLQQIGLVWNRMWISALGLLFLPGVLKGIRELGKRALLQFFGIGTLVAIHWITFYGSIKLGNSASVTLACMATTPLFTSFVEPFITGRKLLRTEVLLGLLTILGVYFVSGAGSYYYPAMITGIISAFLASCFSTLNKKYAGEHPAITVAFVELTSGWLFITMLLPFYFWWDSQFVLMPQANNLTQPWHFMLGGIHSDWLYLLCLGWICTSLAFVFSLHALKHLSAFVSNLSINLEPVYGMILAALLLGENKDLNTPFYLGAGIILGCVLLHPVLERIEMNKLKKA